MRQPQLQQKTSIRIAQILAAVVIGLFMIDQVIGAGHYHAPPAKNLSISVYKVSAADPCPLCLHHSFSNFAVSIAPRVAEPHLLLTVARLEPGRAVALELRFGLFGRAPPATV